MIYDCGLGGSCFLVSCQLEQVPASKHTNYLSYTHTRCRLGSVSPVFVPGAIESVQVERLHS